MLSLAALLGRRSVGASEKRFPVCGYAVKSQTAEVVDRMHDQVLSALSIVGLKTIMVCKDGHSAQARPPATTTKALLQL